MEIRTNIQRPRVAVQSALQSFHKAVWPNKWACCAAQARNIAMICSWTPSLFPDRSSELLTVLENNHFQ